MRTYSTAFHRITLFAVACTAFAVAASGQVRTVGVFQHDADGFGGYTLLAPLLHPSTYLINQYGEVVNQWTHDQQLGVGIRLLENGNLLRSSATPESWVVQGGQGGRLEEIEWDGTVVWQYDYVTDKIMLHHDIVPMPNGNVLTTAWERMDATELEAVGYDITLLTDDTHLFSERIIEFKPIPPDGADIVWEWSAFDHLVQDHDPAKPNYGEIKDYPARIDVNTGTGGSWLHFNGLDYNPRLNLIMVSAGYFNEVWVINRKTTTAEAAGTKGDLLYRFGNPQMYGVGDDSDQLFSFNHNPHWITTGLPGEGNILVFNNGRSIPPPHNSSVHEFALPYYTDYDGNIYFNIGTDGAYEPPVPVWDYDNPSNFYSSVTSGMQRLPNGHTAILEGMTGRMFEIDEDKNKVWEYVNPVVRAGPLARDEPVPTFIPNDPNPHPIMQNALFRSYRYAADYPGLADKDLTPGGVIELPPTAIEANSGLPSDVVLHPNYPNPFNPTTQLSFTLDAPRHVRLTVLDVWGRTLAEPVHELRPAGLHEVSFEASHLSSGVYFYRLETDVGSQVRRMLLIK